MESDSTLYLTHAVNVFRALITLDVTFVEVLCLLPLSLELIQKDKKFVEGTDKGDGK